MNLQIQNTPLTIINMSKKTIFTKAPGLKVMEDMKENKTGAVGTGRVSDAMKRQKERFRDKMRKCVAPGTKKARAVLARARGGRRLGRNEICPDTQARRRKSLREKVTSLKWTVSSKKRIRKIERFRIENM